MLSNKPWKGTTMKTKLGKGEMAMVKKLRQHLVQSLNQLINKLKKEGKR